MFNPVSVQSTHYTDSKARNKNKIQISTNGRG
jgi:hypothetical protein